MIHLHLTKYDLIDHATKSFSTNSSKAHKATITTIHMVHFKLFLSINVTILKAEYILPKRDKHTYSNLESLINHTVQN